MPTTQAFVTIITGDNKIMVEIATAELLGKGERQLYNVPDRRLRFKAELTFISDLLNLNTILSFDQRPASPLPPILWLRFYLPTGLRVAGMVGELQVGMPELPQEVLGNSIEVKWTP